MSAGLDLNALSASAGGQPILTNVTMTALPGALTGLIGPNGAGKSTLLRASLGLVPLSSGSATFAGHDLPAMPRRDRARLAAFVEQIGANEAHLTAREVVMLGRIPFQSIWQAEPSSEDETIVTASIAAVGMSDFDGRHYNTLSGGEQQRLQIARALAQQPQLLLLDEPTNHLDVHAQLTALNLLRTRARAGATVLLALHDLNLAAAFCDALIVLHRGQVAAQGSPQDVLTPALLRDVYNVDATLVNHPTSGRPMIAYDLPS